MLVLCINDFTWIGCRRSFLALSCCLRVVLFPVVVCVEEFLKPLYELKIVLEPPFHQPFNWDDLQQEANKYYYGTPS